MKENKTKTSIKILIVLYVLITYSGLNLLYLRFISESSIMGLNIWWWGLFHRVVAIMTLCFTILHIRRHYKWYKGLSIRTCSKKSKITQLLSVSFSLTVLSTFILAFNIHSISWEILHSIFGVIVFLFATIHTLKRYKL